MSETYGTFATAYVDAMRLRLSALEAENKRLAARVAELEARTREAEESNANAQARLSAAEATIESRRVENEAVRRQLGRAENACDAMEKRVAELETINRSNRAIMAASHSEATSLEAWAKANDVTVATMTDGWIAFDSDVRRGVCGKTITDAVRALREKMESRPAEKATPCPHCLRVECECSDFDVAPDMGDK